MTFTSYETNSFFFKILETFVPNICICDNFNDYMNVTANGKINLDYINQSFVASFKPKNLTCNFKFNILKEMLNNPFMTDEKKDELFNYYYLAQKANTGFKKLVNFSLHKKSKKYEFDCDLCLQPLCEIGNKFVISLLEGNTTYKFRIHDLVRLIENALTYAPDLFSDPQNAKNPHTNLEFSKANLYNIYLHIVENKIKTPTLFHLYYICGFDLQKVLDDYEAILRDHSIVKNFEEMDDDDKYDEIMDMIVKYKRTLTSISISPTFSQDKVVDRFKHTLLNFMYTKYSYNPSLKMKKKELLIDQLEKINDETPAFGRTIFRVRPHMMRQVSGTLDIPLSSVHINNPFVSVPDPFVSTSENIRNLFSTNMDTLQTFDREIESILDGIVRNTIYDNIEDSQLYDDISTVDSDDTNSINDIDVDTTIDSSVDDELVVNGTRITNNPVISQIYDLISEDEDLEDNSESTIDPPTIIPEPEQNYSLENLQNDMYDARSIEFDEQEDNDDDTV